MRLFTAKALVGKFVRFRGLPKDCEPTPIRVSGVTSEGMLHLEGWAGEFAPHLFVVVECPNAWHKEKGVDVALLKCPSCGHSSA